jgi:Leucine-rich repeat (LRR) protein
MASAEQESETLITAMSIVASHISGWEESKSVAKLSATNRAISELCIPCITHVFTKVEIPLGRANIRELIIRPSDNVIDVTFATAFMHLRYLNIRNSGVSKLPSLGHLKHLRKLDISIICVSDLAPLRGLQLRELLLNTCVKDLSPLEDMTTIEVLEARESSISDVTALRNMNRMRILELACTYVTDISALENMPFLEELDLSETQVADLAPLRGKKHMRSLNISCCPVEYLIDLEDMTSMEELYMGDNKITDLYPIRHMKKMQILTFGNNKISDLSPIEGMFEMSELKMNGTLVSCSSTASLRGMKKLVRLDMDNTRVSDVSFLEEFPDMCEVSMQGTMVSLENLFQLMTHYIINEMSVTVEAYRLWYEFRNGNMIQY